LVNVKFCFPGWVTKEPDVPATAVEPQPRGEEDGPGIGGPTPDGQAELGAEPT